MASVKPTAFAGEEYIRIGSYKKKLKDFPEKNGHYGSRLKRHHMKYELL